MIVLYVIFGIFLFILHLFVCFAIISMSKTMKKKLTLQKLEYNFKVKKELGLETKKLVDIEETEYHKLNEVLKPLTGDGGKMMDNFDGKNNLE